MSADNEVTIRIRGFTYYKTIPNPSNPDQDIRQAAFATRGQTISLEEDDYERGLKEDAFVNPDAEEEGEEGVAASIEVVEVSDDELDVYFSEQSPTVDEVLALATDAESAQRLLDAENRATGNDPRKGVEEGIARIVGQGE